MSMRVEVTSTTVMLRLHASATIGRSLSGGLAVISVPGGLRTPAVEDADGNVGRHRRQDRARVQHLRAEVREL